MSKRLGWIKGFIGLRVPDYGIVRTTVVSAH